MHHKALLQKQFLFWCISYLKAKTAKFLLPFNTLEDRWKMLGINDLA
jgi:hypothetical protein